MIIEQIRSKTLGEYAKYGLINKGWYGMFELGLDFKVPHCYKFDRQSNKTLKGD